MLRRRKIKLHWSVGLPLIPSRVDHSFCGATGDIGDAQQARKISSSLVLQLSTRIVSPGRKVSASTSHTVPRWVPILERENRSSYLQARLSNATIVWSSGAEVGGQAFTSYFLKTCVMSCA